MISTNFILCFYCHSPSGNFNEPCFSGKTVQQKFLNKIQVRIKWLLAKPKRNFKVNDIVLIKMIDTEQVANGSSHLDFEGTNLYHFLGFDSIDRKISNVIFLNKIFI